MKLFILHAVSLILLALSFNSANGRKLYVRLDDKLNPYITNDSSPSFAVASAKYHNKLHSEGFVYLSVETNPGFRDQIQAYCAGFLEGHMTSRHINHSMTNSGLPKTDKKGKEFMVDNFRYLKKMIDENESDTLWYQANLILFQIKGMEDAYLGKAGQVTNDVDPTGLFYMWNMATELSDINTKFRFGKTQMNGTGSCSAIVKNSGNDLITSHVTWNEYAQMLRIIKKYNFPYRNNIVNGGTVPGNTVLFSSYPGLVMSGDDYYITNQQLVIQETTNMVYNQELYNNVNDNGTIPYWIKVVLAYRLSTTGEDWVNIFTKHNMGTYNNQWMIVDYKKFSAGNATSGTLWVLETLPGLVVSQDLTHILNTGTKAWTSYNAPYFPEIQKLDDVAAMEKKYGNFYSHDKCPRANIFGRDLRNAVDLNTTINLMRYNDFMHDPFAKCDCTPLGASGENGISARSDLNPINGTYKLQAEGPRCHGGTDLKITDEAMVLSMNMVAISGPTHEEQPVFDWSKQKNTACQNVSHFGMPDRFDFKPVLVSI